MAATLYRVQTRTDAIEGYDDVLITWAAAGRTSPVAPYADVIEGLGSGDEADLFRRRGSGGVGCLHPKALQQREFGGGAASTTARERRGPL